MCIYMYIHTYICCPTDKCTYNKRAVMCMCAYTRRNCFCLVSVHMHIYQPKISKHVLIVFFFSFSSPNFYSLSFSLSTPSSSYIIKNGITSYFSVSLSLCLFFSSLLFFSSQQQIQTLTPQSTPGASAVPSSSQPVPLGTSQQVRQPVLNILHGQFLKQTCDSFKFTVS